MARIGYGYQAEILSLMGDQTEALKKYSRSLTTATELAQDEPQDLEARLSIAKLHTALGVVLSRAGRYSEAQAEFRTTLKDSDELLAMRPHDAETLYLSKMTRDYLTALNRCSLLRICETARRFQLPDLNN
jgi:tetratricopeptide (TPR) repeat protein